MNSSPISKEALTITQLNKELKEMNSDVNQCYKEMDESKIKLKKIIASYNYLLNGVNTVKLEDAMKEEVKVLARYEKMQEEMIQKLRNKVKTNQYVSMCGKLSKLKEKCANSLGENELISLLIQLDSQLTNLEKRKQKLKKKVNRRKEEVDRQNFY